MIAVSRLAELFVIPAERRDPPARAGEDVPPAAPLAPVGPRTAAAVAVLAPAADAAALGAVLGLALARAQRAPAAVVCVWSPVPERPSWRAPARAAARRLAATLAARGHEAYGSGRLVVVRLAAGREDGAAEALRVSAAAGAAPTVLALAGPRRAELDIVLAAQDLVVVALPPESNPALAQLAVAGLERALACELPPADPARALAAAGLMLLPSTRRAIAAPVAALS